MITEEALRTTARTLYPDGDLVSRSQRLRQLICPFEPLVEAVPEDSTVLDIGCGAGLLLGLLASTGRITRGVGFDADAGAIRAANAMAELAGLADIVAFHHVGVDDDWPSDSFDAVTMIDVMHHIPRAARPGVMDNIAATLAGGGTFVYKDMDSRPLWRGFGNRLHDLVLARDWIAYESLDDVVAAASARDLSLEHSDAWARYWYGHHLAVLSAA